MMCECTVANKVLPKAGLNGFDWAYVQGSTFVLRLNFSAKMPCLRQAAKTLPASVKDDTTTRNRRLKTEKKVNHFDK